MISYNSQGRDHAIDLIISAIRSAIQYCASHDTLTSATVTTKAKESKPDETKQQKADVHETADDAVDTDGLEAQLKEAVITVLGSAKAAFDALSKDGVMGKKEGKKLIKRALPSLKPGHAKWLRKRLPGRMSLVDFCSFIDGTEEAAISSNDKAKRDKSKDAESSGLASLPPEVPEVCLTGLSYFVWIDRRLCMSSFRLASGLVSMPRSNC